MTAPADLAPAYDAALPKDAPGAWIRAAIDRMYTPGPAAELDGCPHVCPCTSDDDCPHDCPCQDNQRMIDEEEDWA